MAAPRIGFVGIGNMGWPMARNLVQAGYPVIVYDKEPGRAARFEAEHGGRAAESPAAVGGEADLVIAMLPTGGDVRDIVLGADDDRQTPAGSRGVASSLRDGAIIVDMSSSDPVGTRTLGATLSARGIALIDAPVSGLVAKAETGALTIMIGCDDEKALTVAEPVLRVLGERLVRVGRLGCGHAMKALNNVVAASAFAATAEALIVGKRFGLDPAVMTEVMSSSTGRNFHTEMSFPAHVLPRKFSTGFTLGLLAKDVSIAAELCASLEATTPVIDLVSRLFAEGRDEVGASEDNTAVVKRWERLNGVIVAPGEHGE